MSPCVMEYLGERNMNKRSIMLFSALVITICIFLSACSVGKSYNVSFNAGYDNAAKIETVKTSFTGKIKEPETPVREGYKFTGWYIGDAQGKPFDFSKDKIKENSTLFAGWEKEGGEEFASDVKDKDFSKISTPGSQETAYEYKLNFLPALDGINQPHVGDPMPYYEDGVYYFYYLKEGGDSYNHSIYLTTTTDFITYKEYDDPIIESNRAGGQDAWAGTGNVVKVNNKYYFFYTGHAPSDTYEYIEKIMVAVGDDPFHFTKLSGWDITPPAAIVQKVDFRDPQAYYDAETDTIYMTVTAAKNNLARILKYTLSPDLSEVEYEGVLFTEMNGDYWNLECSDCFKIGDKWYLTYSGQDDTLFYAIADSRFGTYSDPIRLDGKLFYAAKQVSNGTDNYMVGWTRRSESPSSTQEVSAWGGNLQAQRLSQNEDGTLCLAPIESVVNAFNQRRELSISSATTVIKAGKNRVYSEVFNAYERFLITGEFTYTDNGKFGLAFEFGTREKDYKLIYVDPESGKICLAFGGGNNDITESAVSLEKGKTYSFTYIQEGSVGVFYVDGKAALTARVYGVTGKPIRLFSENNTVAFNCLKEYTMQ